jgi:MoxR-like ATPase
MYPSPNETLWALERVGYFIDLRTATTVYLAGNIHHPIMLEGPAGAGKTELASSVARAYGEPLIRLQCYQGINEEKAIGQYDRSLQELYPLDEQERPDARLGGNQKGSDQQVLLYGRTASRCD